MTAVGRRTTTIRRVGGLLMRPSIKALFVAGAALTGYVAAHATPPEPIVITQSPETLEARGARAPRGTAFAAPPAGQTTTAAGQTATAQVACTLPAPDASSTCVNGFWQAPAGTGAGAARFDRANGCVTVQPANDMICRNGLWTLRGADTSGQNSATTTTTDPMRPPSFEAPPSVPSTTNVSPTMSSGNAANPAATGSVAAGSCPGSPPSVSPSQSVACVNGAWVVR
jgi:hypothetical protein